MQKIAFGVGGLTLPIAMKCTKCRVGMNKIIFSAVLIATMGLSPLLSFAQTGTAYRSDAEAGRAKSAVCAACHGTNGNSASDQFPNIAGQVDGYIAAQLAKFKSGERDNLIMAGMVAILTPADMADLDAYYANQPAAVGSITPEQETTARAGEAIYRGGIEKYHVPPCMACHGPSGAGVSPNFPRLGGQHATYLEAQLLAFKSGQRTNEIMQPIAFPLSEQQIKQLALYLSGLQ